MLKVGSFGKQICQEEIQMKKVILLKYGEIILKGLNRPIFEDALIKNLKQSAFGEKIKIWKAQATIYVEALDDSVDMDNLAVRLSKVFGIVSATVAYTVPKELDKICELAATLIKNEKGNTFKVETKRADKNFPIKSPVVSMEVGGAILDANPSLTVDVHNPDILVMVEIRDFAAYIYMSKIQGVGGMPVGTNGKATLLLSGGIDSPVAGYMVAKRGVTIDAVHFYSYPYTSERAKEKVLELAQILADYCGRINVHIVPFTEIQLAINEKCPQEQMTVIMRRIMMYIANSVAKKNGSLGLITGESIGQVASQTIQALGVTDDASDLPVFRPVIGMDKDEIITIARKIGTFETSILPYEDCCTVFTPKHPNTKPVLEKIKKSESLLDLEPMMERALEGVETVVVKRR